MRAILFLVVTAAAGTAGCSGCPASALGIGCSEERTFRDTGKLCLYPASETQGTPAPGAPPIDSTRSRTYEADQPVNVAVRFDACLSSSCSVDRKAGCTAELVAGNGQRLVVGSYGSYQQKAQGACTADCGSLIARCSSPPLPAGNYTVEHGSASSPFTIPFDGPPPCLDTAEP
ncbi:MAG TPA: hypothetical protein VFV95_05700 [Vicinamibacterales bacterium]|nr:hypothetical protein [Vicinamibacterales bacterium]